VDPKRMLLAKGDIFLMLPEKNKAKEYYYLMFSDYFLLTVKKDDMYYVRYYISIANSSLTQGGTNFFNFDWLGYEFLIFLFL
jgi:hypothetical protein